MFDDYTRWHVLLLASPCGQCCIDTEFLPLIKVSVWVLVGVRCNYSWLIIETWVSLEKPSQTDLFHKQLYVSVPTLAAKHTFTVPQEISSEHQLLSGCIVTDIYKEHYWQKCANSVRFIKWAAALCLLGDLTVFTQQSAPQCCPISRMTHWIADLCVCMWRGRISCNYRESS